MPDLSQQMRESVHDAAQLEQLYRAESAGFQSVLPGLIVEFPDSGILQAWAARLDIAEENAGKTLMEASEEPRLSRFLPVVLLSLLAGGLAKIPAYFGGFEIQSARVEEFFYSRDTAFCVLPLLAVYFAVVRRGNVRNNLAAAAAMALAAVYINLLPDESLEKNAGLALACLHVPAFLGWAVFAVFAGTRWREGAARTEFVRLVGESVVYTALVLLTGIIMTFVTMALFRVIGLNIKDFYLQWVVVLGAAASPVVGTHLASERLQGKLLLAPLIARLFSPLVLITLVVYLIGVAVQHEKLFADRESLLIFNVVSWIVLAMAAFNLCAWQKPGWLDRVLLTLVGLTLLINLLALAAIIYRIHVHGLSPNRDVLLGWNVLMSIHLVGLAIKLWNDIRRASGMESARRWLVGYLPVYAAWNTLVLFTVPWW